jgi:hypothetical protein
MTIFLNPVIILASLIVDMVSLPNLLMQDERNFEFKYPTSLDVLTTTQLDTLSRIFVSIFYVQFTQEYANRAMTLIELMVMHRKIFCLTENMHDLVCRGLKDYKEALATV